MVVADGDISSGRAIHEEALALSREGGDRWATAWALTNLGAAHTAQLDLGQADADSTDALLGEAIAIWKELGERRHLAFCQVGLAKAALARRDVRLARHLLEEALSTFTDLQDVVGTANCLANWADLFRTRGQYVQCVHLLAATYGQVKGRFYRLWTGIAEQRLDLARRALGTERFEAAWRAGYTTTQAEAVAYAWHHSSLD